MEYTHGGDIWDCENSPVDFSANLNPLGMPPAVARAAAAAVADARHYPDPHCRALTAAIARHDGVPPQWVLCGNGAADLIFRMVWALTPRRALVTAPTFSEYGQALGAVGCQILFHQLRPEQNFDLTDAILDDLTADVDLCFLCTPNNPTGRVIEGGLLSRILEHCAARDIWLVLDECFLELTEGGRGLAPQLGAYPKLVLLRAFTKSYAIPGLRLGYCLSADEALLEGLSAKGQPWGVSGPAQAAGVAALLKCADHPAAARALIKTERGWLSGQMTALGLMLWPGAANYLLFRAVGVHDLRERLLTRGVLIRACGNYAGLGEDYYRVAVRPHEENEILISALKEVL